MNFEASSNWIALGIGVVLQLVVALVVLHIKTSIGASLSAFRGECDAKYESKELANERHTHLTGRIDELAGLGRAPHGTR